MKLSLLWKLGGICDALCNLVPIVQFKKREKHPCMSVTFSVTFSKVSRDIFIFVFVKFTNFKIRDVIIGIAT